MEITLQPIGYLETPFNDIADMPIQPSVLADTRGKAVLDEKFAPGLKDLDGFSHKISGYQLEVVPFMDTLPHGIFATRSPKRPNRIGMSIVRMESVVGNIVQFKGVDMLNGSPLLDIKPYYSYFDQQTQVRNGWLEGKTLRPENLRSDKRFES